MKLPPHYKSIQYGEIPIPSTIVALLHEEDEEPSLSFLNRRLTRYYGERYTLDPTPRKQSFTSILEAELTLPGTEFKENEEAFHDRMPELQDLGSETDPLKDECCNPELEKQYKITIVKVQDILKVHLENESLTDEEYTKIQNCEWGIAVETFFDESMVTDFHHQIQLAWLLVPEATALIDLSACVIHSRDWFKSLACSRNTPRPDDLYSIHTVPDNNSSKSRGSHYKGHAWLHTHGLLRCRCFDLEIPGATEDQTHLLKNIIHNVAHLHLYSVITEPAQTFKLVSNITITWLPWEKAMGRMQSSWRGQKSDRDEYHRMPSAMLLKQDKFLFFNRYESIAGILPKLKDQYLDYASRQELARLEKLALEQYDVFHRYFLKHKTSKSWLFTIKVKININNEELDEDFEQCWIQVESAQEDQFEGTLISSSFINRDLVEGSHMVFSLDQLADWNISNNKGTFNGDRVHLLE